MPPKATQFKKGKGVDPRINRKGRPKNFSELRELAQSLAHEPATIKRKDGTLEPIIYNGKQATVAEMILREWTRDSKHQEQFVKVAFGDVPLTIRTWQDEVIDMLKAGKLNANELYSELGERQAAPLLIAAGIRRNEVVEVESEGATATDASAVAEPVTIPQS